MSFAEIATHHRRLVILRLLGEAPENTANDSILHAGLSELGHACSRDQVRGDLAWLDEQGLVGVEDVKGFASHIQVARLTERGDDVQAGRTTVPGVKRPSPRS
jgi:hypothetical protein